MSALRLVHDRARNLGLCGVIAADFAHVCNRPADHDGEHSWPDNGWNLCECGHAVVEHEASRQLCCICICRAFVTPSRTDRQPPNPVAGAKGGKGAVAPETTNRPDLVTRHETLSKDTGGTDG